jgi:hypothetical protein
LWVAKKKKKKKKKIYIKNFKKIKKKISRDWPISTFRTTPSAPPAHPPSQRAWAGRRWADIENLIGNAGILKRMVLVLIGNEVFFMVK